MSMQVQHHMTEKIIKLILANLLHLRKEGRFEITKSAILL